MAHYDRDAARVLFEPIAERFGLLMTQEFNPKPTVWAGATIDPAATARMIERLPDEPRLKADPFRPSKDQALADIASWLASDETNRWDRAVGDILHALGSRGRGHLLIARGVQSRLDRPQEAAPDFRSPVQAGLDDHGEPREVAGQEVGVEIDQPAVGGGDSRNGLVEQPEIPASKARVRLPRKFRVSSPKVGS